MTWLPKRSLRRTGRNAGERRDTRADGHCQAHPGRIEPKALGTSQNGPTTKVAMITADTNALITRPARNEVDCR